MMMFLVVFLSLFGSSILFNFVFVLFLVDLHFVEYLFILSYCIQFLIYAKVLFLSSESILHNKEFMKCFDFLCS